MLPSIKVALFVLLFSSMLNADKTSEAAHTITIAGTADLQGMMEPVTQKFDLNFEGEQKEMSMGGISRIATVFKQLKTENPSTVTVSTGDDLMNRFFHIFKGKAIFSLMSDAGYDLYAFGNHEFDKGSEVLSQALKNTSFQPICSDLDVSHAPLKGKCQSYIIKDLDGVKVGFFSIMTENLALVTRERNVTVISDNVTTAKKMVAFLKEKRVNIIVALSHIGYKEDVKLAKQVKGIDLIFGGHSHDYVKKIGHVNKTAIVNGGEKGSQIVKVDIPVTKNLKVLHKKVTMTKIPIPASIVEDKEIEAKVIGYVNQFPDSIILGQTEKEWNMSKDELRKSESTVANMINDLMREQFNVEIVLNNAGAFRGQKVYKAGPITDTMLKEIDEFGNYAYILRLKGTYLKEILERSAATYDDGGFLQISGLKYHITLPSQAQVIENRKIIKKGERVDNIKILIDKKWQPLDLNRKYTILSNSFIINEGAYCYFWFKKYGIDLKNTYSTFYTIMVDFLAKKKVLSPEKKDGRLKIIH